MKPEAKIDKRGRRLDRCLTERWYDNEDVCASGIRFQCVLSPDHKGKHDFGDAPGRRGFKDSD